MKPRPVRVGSSAVCLALLALVLAPAACGRSDAAPADVKAKIAAGALVVDVRTPAEVAQGKYPGAVNIPVDQIEQRLGELGDPKRPVVLYCRTGNRSAKAKAILVKHGFADVTNAGGLKDMPPR